MTPLAAHEAVPREAAWTSLWLGLLLSVAPLAVLVAIELCQELGLAPHVDTRVSLAYIIAGAAMSGLGVVLFGLAWYAARRVGRERAALVAQQREALGEARAALAQARKMEALGRLSGGIAHDLNNLLQVITNNMALLEQGMDSGDPYVREYLDMAKRSVERAVGVTQRLLGFSRQQSPVTRAIHTNQLVGEMAELLRHSFRDSMGIRTRFGTGVGGVLTDPVELETAILNRCERPRCDAPVR
jgi:signal transduction histidine kinase